MIIYHGTLRTFLWGFMYGVQHGDCFETFVSLQFAVTNHPLKLASYCAQCNEVSASIKVGTFWIG